MALLGNIMKPVSDVFFRIYCYDNFNTCDRGFIAHQQEYFSSDSWTFPKANQEQI